MKVRISLSVFAESSGAVGHVDGNLDFPIEPMIGDTISFLVSSNDVSLDPSLGFDGLLKVEYRTFTPNQENSSVSLMFEDLHINDRGNALQIMNFLESEFGLNAHIY